MKNRSLKYEIWFPTAGPRTTDFRSRTPVHIGNDMPGQIYEVEISHDGRLDFQAQVLEELKGKKVRLILLADDDEWESSTDELQEAVDQDWADWLDVREDIFEEYRGQIPKG